MIEVARTLLERIVRQRYTAAMFGPKSYFYIVDGLTAASGETIRKSLSIVADIKSVSVDPGRGTVEVKAFRDVEDNVRLACEVAGVTFRTRLRR